VRSLIRRLSGGAWRIELEGPLRVRLATIELNGDTYRIERPQTGQVYSGSISGILPLPELEVDLEEVGHLGSMLLPAINLEPARNWRIASATYGHPGELTLVSEAMPADSLVLKLDYSPLRVHYETLWSGGELAYRRAFRFDRPDDALPSGWTVALDGIELDISIDRIRLLKIDHHPRLAQEGR